MMFIRSGLSWFTFGKQATNCFKQCVFSRYLYTDCHSWQLMKQNHGYKLLQCGKTNSCYGTGKLLNQLSTRKTFGLFECAIGQLGMQKGCDQHHSILQVASFSTSQKETVVPSPAAANKHWGPYLVHKIHNLEESSRFHGYSTLRWGVSIITVTLVTIYVFRDQLRDNVADEVADVASRSLADENVILKAHDMTKGVLKRLTSEEDTTILVSEFLKTVLQQSEVQNVVVSFATNVLNHPQTQEKLREVVRNTLHSTLNNTETKDMLLGFIKSLIEDPQTKQTCNMFLQSLTKDPDIQKMVSEFFKGVLASPAFQKEAIMLGREVTNKIVHDEDLQRQTGDALWNAMKHGVTPYWFRAQK
ncbi:uncharacterized protein LOC114522327 [Dendronephthya gigantea]|uniref:uncharacterized protein LOC114522327 n=1 Tax=Dendronephthya gigantea TaxID=151771 RepID=UPI00106D66EC|nr:uncharacterized protein LOC114522327 [Dendronephthya gigantea]